VTQNDLVIENRVINCQSQGFVVDATGVIIRNSIVNGGVYTTFRETSAAADNNSHPTVFTIESSYITTDGTDGHQSGLRALKNTTLRGNTVTCKPSSAGYDGGCSAHAVFYSERVDGTPAAAFNLTIERNYFKRSVTPGGAEGGPWFAVRHIDCDNRSDCTNVKVTWNLFDLGQGTDGGEHPENATGSVWADNYWTDGTTAESNESR
jgi:hypothetical protein